MILEVLYRGIPSEAMVSLILRLVRISLDDEDLLQQGIVTILWLLELIFTIISHVMNSSVSRLI
jgi:hypothetical protein